MICSIATVVSGVIHFPPRSSPFMQNIFLVTQKNTQCFWTWTITAAEHEVTVRGERIALKLKLNVENNVDFWMHESFLIEFMSSFVIMLIVLTMECKCFYLR